MIWMSGLDMGCFYFNRAWLDFRGRLLSEEYGNGWAAGVHPDDLDRCVQHYTSCFQERVPFAMNYRLRHYSGEYYWILDRGAPHYSANGRFLGFFGGCAETEAIDPAVLNSQLRTGLAGVSAFAREIASAQLSFGATQGTGSLKAFAQQLRRAHAESAREMKHVAGQFEQLATDMVAYGDIPHGACLR